MELPGIEYETDPAGFADGGGDPGEFTAIEDPGQQTYEPAPAEPAPAPDYISRAELEQFLQERDAQLAYQQAYQQPQYADPYAQQPYQQPGPQLDPFDEGFGQNLAELVRGIVMEAQQPVQQMLDPIAQSYQDQQAQQWAEQTFQSLGVPGEEPWRDAALAASAGYERDPYGRPVPPQMAVRQGYEALQRLVQHERAKWEAEQQTQQQNHTQRLQAVTQAPNLPAGGGGGVEAPSQPRNMREAVHAAAERVLAS